MKLESPALRVVLVEPEIPPNTGNIARLCAAARLHLVLVGKLGFSLDERHLRRAGLDYWPLVSWEHAPDLDAWVDAQAPDSLHLLTTRAHTPYPRIPAVWGDALVFGKETAGLPESLLRRFPRQCYTIPMLEPGVRSLNLSSAVALVTYDVLQRVRPFPAL